MTVEGISGLLRSTRLQVLDIGVLPVLLKQPYSTVVEEEDIELPKISKLTPTLSKDASAKLKYLRVDYQLVTEDAPTDVGTPLRAELDGSPGYQILPGALELEEPKIFMNELESTDNTVVEASGESLHLVELPNSSCPVEIPGCMPQSPPSGESTTSNSLAKAAILPPQIMVTKELPEVKRGGAYAPEPVCIDGLHTLVSPWSGNSDSDIEAVHTLTDNGACLSPSSPTFPPKPGGSIRNRSRHNSTSYVEDRRARLDMRQSQENRLHPGMLPNVHTLVLTNVPLSTTGRQTIDRVIQYIKDAAEEAAIARQRAEHTYALPPGRSRAVAEREHAYGLFALRRLVLEMAPPQAAPKKVSTSWRAYPTKSSTEDTDSEAFWDAAAHDFSFFGEEECGLPDTEPGRTLPLAAMSGLELAPQRSTDLPEPMREAEDGHSSLPLLDVIGEIAKFRKGRKAAYNNLVQMGHSDADVEGYWPGDVTVIRRSVTQDAGELDCYGNRYEAGWYYR